MAQPVIQTSFNAGEWAPALNARVDLTKYHTGAATLRNFFVDYRGGATFRAGTRYVIQCLNSVNPVRLIPFTASFTVSYVLEFGQGYIRFINNGAPVLEAAKTITNINVSGADIITSASHGFVNGDWIFITGVVGTVGNILNGNYFIVRSATTNTFALNNLLGAPVALNVGTYVSGGTAARIYTLISPYQGNEVFGIRYAQNSNYLVLCHPNYPPYQLVLTSATSWAISPITFGTTINAPTGQSASTTLGASIWNYAYVITTVDSNGQESAPSSAAAIANVADIRSTAGSNTVTWSAVAGAASYNVYKAIQRASVGVPIGAAYGFIGNCTSNTFVDSNITPDFSQGPPVLLNPFAGAGVQSVAVTSAGSYSANTAVPVATPSGGGGSGATFALIGQLQSVISISSGGSGYIVGDAIVLTGGIVLQVTAVTFSVVTAVSIVSRGSFGPGGNFPANPLPQISSPFGTGASFNVNYQVGNIQVTVPGTGYSTPPTVNITAGGPTATATSTLGASSSGNPTVPTFFQQRLVLAGPVASPQQINMSATATPFNFNNHNPIQDDDSIQANIISGQLNTIQSMVSQPQGLITLTDKAAWLINGGSPGSAVTPSGIVANAHSFVGANALPPLVLNDNILYVQSKNSIVRDMTYNFYTAVYTGTDISVLSSHLFYGYSLVDWARVEEPFKTVWAVRNDGQMLTLTFLKEQELIAWTHSDTQGSFKSVASVTESVGLGNVDALYTIVQRNIGGNNLQYIERMTELYYPNGVTDAWNVDAGIQFNGAATLSFSGAQHLANMSVTGLATDNLGNVTVIAPLTVSGTGTFTLPAPTPQGATGYTRVTVGLSYLGQLKTLPLDLGEPTVQGKRKKITGVTVRVKDTLGLTIGRDFSAASQKAMKDLVVGNVGTMSNTVVTGLVTGDARTIIDPLWDVPGQYAIQQSNPYPTSILGVIPEIEVGDTK